MPACHLTIVDPSASGAFSGDAMRTCCVNCVLFLEVGARRERQRRVIEVGVESSVFHLMKPVVLSIAKFWPVPRRLTVVLLMSRLVKPS